MNRLANSQRYTRNKDFSKGYDPEDDDEIVYEDLDEEDYDYEDDDDYEEDEDEDDA